MTGKPRRIAIIGGGYTGLVAAYRLAQTGHEVFVFERNAEVGGLAADFAINGTSLEKAYHHIFKTDTSIIALAKELGVDDKLEWLESRTALVYGRRVYSFATPLDLIRFTAMPLVARVRTGLVTLFLQRYTNWHTLRGHTALAWMRRWAGSASTRVIWEPLLRGKFHHFFDAVSMGWLWARLHVRTNSREEGTTDERLGYFRDGFVVFTEALVAALTKLGVRITTAKPIDSVSREPNGTYSVDSGSTREQFDAVVMTTPSSVFNRLTATIDEVPSEYRQRLDSIPYLAARVMIFTSTQDISEYYWHNINDLDLPFLVFIHHTSLVDRTRYGNEFVYYVATYAPHDDTIITRSDEELVETWFDGLREIFPDIDREAVTSTHVFTLRDAQHVVDTDYHNRIPEYETGAAGLFLANFTQIYPEDRGTNFAVREGEKIARLVDAGLTA